MFDTMKVAQRIREARNARNMTQTALADEMGVSYQAVSNWERGNSMPDISKLEQLCQVLHITVSELLGSDEKQAATVRQILRDGEPPAAEDVADIAPIVPPEKIRESVNDSAKKGNLNIKAIVGMAPFLDNETLDGILRQVEPDDYGSIAALAPFLSSKTLNDLVFRCEGTVDKQLLFCLAPFLSTEALDKLVWKYEGEADKGMVAGLAPFLGSKTLDRLVEQFLRDGDVSGLTSLYPFLSKETMQKLAWKMMEVGDFDAMRDASVFL